MCRDVGYIVRRKCFWRLVPQQTLQIWCLTDSPTGRRFWLRPGKAHLIGRTPVDDKVDASRGITIEDKTVSRKHLYIVVDPVPPEQCAKPQTRSKITLEDLNTKIGTLIDGEQVRGKKHVLEKDVNVVQIGKFASLFMCVLRS